MGIPETIGCYMQHAMPLPGSGSNGDEFDSDRAARKAQTRAHLRRVAQQLFTDRGFDTVTITNIAAAASVPRGV